MKNTLFNILESTTFNNPQEQALTNAATSELYVKKNKAIVLSELKRKFGKLAMQQKPFAEGVEFLSKISKPDFNVDIAESSTTWF